MSHGNVTTEVGTCPVCRRDDQPLTRKPPIREDMPERLACTDEYTCLARYSAANPWPKQGNTWLTPPEKSEA